MEGTNSLKESEEDLVAVREKAISGSIRQLSVFLSNIVILVDHSGTALLCQEDQDVRIGPERAESLLLKRG